MLRLVDPVICRMKSTLLPKNMRTILATAVFVQLFRLLISQARGTNDSIAYCKTGKQQKGSNSMVINSEFPAKLMKRARVPTPGYVPKKTRWVFFGYTHLKKPTQKNPHFYFNLILVYTLYATNNAIFYCFKAFKALSL